MENQAKRELNKDLDKIMNPKKDEKPEDYLKRMEKEFDNFNDGLNKLLKNI